LRSGGRGGGGGGGGRGGGGGPVDIKSNKTHPTGGDKTQTKKTNVLHPTEKYDEK